MHITNKQLRSILDDGEFLAQDHNDILDWPDELKDRFIASYIESCDKNARADILGEGSYGVDIFKMYTNPTEFLNNMKNSIYQYIESADFNDPLSLRSSIVLELETVRQGYYKQRMICNAESVQRH